VANIPQRPFGQERLNNMPTGPWIRAGSAFFSATSSLCPWSAPDAAAIGNHNPAAANNQNHEGDVRFLTTPGHFDQDRLAEY
jgi:hypothetical protein